MITHLTGKLCDKKTLTVVLDVNGVGYEVFIPMSTCYQLPEMNSTLTLLTHFIVREDTQALYGFYTEQERTLFRALIKVNGVGPKLALTILSGMETNDFVRCIHAQDATRLTHIPGVGKKTAERLIVEMRDALSSWHHSETPELSEQNASLDFNQVIHDAVAALTALGYKPQEAKQVVSKVHQSHHNHEQLIRLALQQMVHL